MITLADERLRAGRAAHAGEEGVFVGRGVINLVPFHRAHVASAERWVGSVRRDLLRHVIVLNQRHLRRLLREYVRYYHEDRTHLGLGKDTRGGRVGGGG